MPQPGTSTTFGPNSLWSPRSPLVYAISEDNCQTWSQPVVVDTGTAAYPSIYFSQNEMFVCYWEDPDPNQAVWCGPNSHLMVVAYDINAILAPEPSTLVMMALALLGVLAYAWGKQR